MEWWNGGIVSIGRWIERTEDVHEHLDELHYRVENELLKLIESLQKKERDHSWDDTFLSS